MSPKTKGWLKGLAVFSLTGGAAAAYSVASGVEAWNLAHAAHVGITFAGAGFVCALLYLSKSPFPSDEVK